MNHTRLRQQLQVLQLLRDREFVSHQVINETIWAGAPSDRATSRSEAILALVASLRSTLRRLDCDIEVQSLLNRGYYLSPANRQRVDLVKRAIRSEQSRAASAFKPISEFHAHATTISSNRIERAELVRDLAD